MRIHQKVKVFYWTKGINGLQSGLIDMPKPLKLANWSDVDQYSYFAYFPLGKTKFLKGIGELARLDFTLLKFGVPILCRECGQKRAVGMFLLKLLYFLTFPEWGCRYQKARSNAMRFAVFRFYGDCHLSSKPQFHTIFEKLALIPCFECLNEKLDK